MCHLLIFLQIFQEYLLSCMNLSVALTIWEQEPEWISVTWLYSLYNYYWLQEVKMYKYN